MAFEIIFNKKLHPQHNFNMLLVDSSLTYSFVAKYILKGFKHYLKYKKIKRNESELFFRWEEGELLNNDLLNIKNERVEAATSKFCAWVTEWRC